MRRLIPILIIFCSSNSLAQTVRNFSDSWEFVKDVDTVFVAKLLGKDQPIAWKKVSLPHTANVEPVQKTAQQWQGTCYYRKFFTVSPAEKGKHIAIQLDAAMQVADVYLNGKHICRHLGGYLPFYMDISDKVLWGQENSLLVRLNNEDNPLVPPGKPLQDLDFNYYSGLYRNAWLIIKDKLYISNAVWANRTAGGGLFVYTESLPGRQAGATSSAAVLSVKTEIRNDHADLRESKIVLTLTDKTGKQVARSESKDLPVASSQFGTFSQTVEVPNPEFWSPESPYLYQLTAELVHKGAAVDRIAERVGVRIVRIEKDGLYLNDKKVMIRGTNRHQEYPYLGNAVSDNAQYRDAYKIKLAGFNFVRASHYPPSPAFLDACDELGILVMDAIPGWQFVGGKKFEENSYQDIRDMIHRDRNHASIILWEGSLNESNMKREYMQKAHEIIHSELPFKGAYSAGWMDGVYDVFLPARQHAKAPDYWKKYDKGSPLLVAEYGDWEYYAQNAGFNQAAYADLKEEERTSRQLRGLGEKRLLQQALNYQEAHNDNLYNKMLGDANWLIFDYNRGYADDIESSGIMDIFRLPKFAFYFYQSQAGPQINSPAFNNPMLFIANYWQPGSTPRVRIFSNCEEVELYVNGKKLGRQRPDKDQYSGNLAHPPFTFDAGSFRPGSLKAAGYIGGKKVVESTLKTPGKHAAVTLRADISGAPFCAGKNDAVFVYAEIVDDARTIVPNYSGVIDFKVEGDATIIGKQSVNAEAGIATILLQAGSTPGKITVTASGTALKGASLALNSK